MKLLIEKKHNSYAMEEFFDLFHRRHVLDILEYFLSIFLLSFCVVRVFLLFWTGWGSDTNALLAECNSSKNLENKAYEQKCSQT